MGNRIYLESADFFTAQLTVTFGDEIDLGFVGAGIHFFGNDGETVSVRELLTNQAEAASDWVRIRIEVREFTTKELATAAGMRVADSLLRFTVSKKISVVFEESSDGAPINVIPSRNGPTIEGRGSIRSVYRIMQDEFQQMLTTSASYALSDVERLSLTFYSASEMEASVEAKFVMLITALESLCNQVNHDDGVKAALAACANTLKNALPSEHPAFNSLVGQIRGLARESVTQAIRRNLAPILSDLQIGFIEKAYKLRSKLLHEGTTIPQLHFLNTELKDTLRLIYSKRFGWPLAYPLQPGIATGARR